MEIKECIGCGLTTPEVKFALIKATGKYKVRCTLCVNLDQKANRLANIDTRRLKEQTYREENRVQIRTQYFSKGYANEQYLLNKAQILKRHNEYNATNATVISEQKKAYYLANREHILERSHQYFLTHRDEYYARNSKRRALLQNAIPAWLTDEEHSRIVLLYKIARKVQSLTGVAMHVDHIYPLKGKTVCGFHCLSNLQILTAKENMEKSNKFPDEQHLKGTNVSNKAANIRI
jgi:hypothetical protein